MKSKIVCALLLIVGLQLKAQKWVDTAYQTIQISNIVYGTAIDFGGQNRLLRMDVSIPANDTPPTCGRPLLIAIHGGAFMGGSKSTGAPPFLMKEFAQRGYVTASINYRLGMFQTASAINCNIPNWNCLNMADTAEWYRAVYRGMQDAKGAIRFLLNQKDSLKIDPKNVFVVGESAGGFIALATAFIDDTLEKHASCYATNTVARPNAIYESPCLVSTGHTTSLSALNLSRPDLGSIHGDLNPTSVNYTIKGVGSIYGAITYDYFSKYAYSKSPVIYAYHQPNDLIVPYKQQRIFHDYNICAQGFPANCQSIVSRPYVYGSSGIFNLIKKLKPTVPQLPDYLFDSTLNTANCAMQVSNPALTGHAIDQGKLRSKNMANFFSKQIDTSSANCLPSAIQTVEQKTIFRVFPNPSSGIVNIQVNANINQWTIQLKEMSGKTLKTAVNQNVIEMSEYKSGLYMIVLSADNIQQTIKFQFIK
jgi:hypothetical protein